MNPSHEARLMLAVARCGAITHANDAVRQSLESPIDWEHALDLLQRHGLGPLAHLHLDALPDVPVPKFVRARLWARAQAIARRNALMAHELGAIVAQLEAQGIGVVPYKGPTLALRAYGDLSLREFGDLDLLVRPGEVIEAKRILGQRGYVPVRELAPHQERQLIESRRDYELAVADRTRRILVELHWRGDPHARVPALEDGKWWDGLPRMTVAGTPCATLPADELGLLLCLHGSKHRWSSLGWLVDVIELARREPGLDWDHIGSMARFHACERRVALALAMAADLLGHDLTCSARISIEGPVREIARRIHEQLFLPEQAQRGPFTGFLDGLRLCDDARQRITFIARAAFVPGWGEWTRWRLPRALFFLYPALRVFRLFAKYALRIGAGEPELPPRLEDRHRHGIGEIEAAVPGSHRQA